MRTILIGLAILMTGSQAAGAGNFSMPAGDAPMSLIQYNGNSQTRTDNRQQQRPQRYVCVVPPAQSDNRNRPFVCRTGQGRIGETCRCSGVTGSGRLDLDD